MRYSLRMTGRVSVCSVIWQLSLVVEYDFQDRIYRIRMLRKISSLIWRWIWTLFSSESANTSSKQIHLYIVKGSFLGIYGRLCCPPNFGLTSAVMPLMCTVMLALTGELVQLAYRSCKSVLSVRALEVTPRTYPVICFTVAGGVVLHNGTTIMCCHNI